MTPTALGPLRSREDFDRLRRARRTVSGPLSMRFSAGGKMVLVGFTIPKSFGNAPQRNRMRRRLRAALGEVANRSGLPEGLVLLGAQPTALTMPFDDLSQHVERLFAQASEATQ